MFPWAVKGEKEELSMKIEEKGRILCENIHDFS